MLALDISQKEKDSGQMSPAHLEAALNALQTDGFVVLNGIVDTAHLDILHERMLADLETIVSRPDAPFNFNTGNVQQDPPPFAPYLFRDILVNDMVIAVTKPALGPGLFNAFYSGNTVVKGNPSRQPVHPDVAQLWPGMTTASPAFGYVVNVSTVDVGPENASTEIWPGTHLDTSYSLRDGSLRIPQDVLDRRREVAPPLQATIKRGGVVIRDIRLWHAGMPNHTDTPRPMIAMIHWIHWWNASETVPFARDAEPILQHPDLTTRARYEDGPINYLLHNAAYDLQK